VGHIERKFQKKGGVVHQRQRQKTIVSRLSRGVVGVILSLAVLIQCRRVTDTQTDRHAMMANERLGVLCWVVVLKCGELDKPHGDTAVSPEATSTRISASTATT